LPFKANVGCRQHFPKQRSRATNRAEYDAALRGRSSQTLWFTEAAIAAWEADPRITQGGQHAIRRSRAWYPSQLRRRKAPPRP
jgi:hypothetical protein